MVKDAEDRGLVYHDVTTLDDSPAWLAKRQAWTAQQQAQYQAERQKQRATYLNHNLRIARKVSFEASTPSRLPTDWVSTTAMHPSLTSDQIDLVFILRNHCGR
jgi:hypothetical protein